MDQCQGPEQLVHNNSTQASIELQLAAAQPHAQKQILGQAVSRAIEHADQQIMPHTIERTLALGNQIILDIIQGLFQEPYTSPTCSPAKLPDTMENKRQLKHRKEKATPKAW